MFSLNNKVVALTVGGTIGSLTGATKISITKQSEKELTDRLVRLSSDVDFEFEIVNVANVASNTLEPEDWTLISREIGKYSEVGVDRFLITHGTDTLHFTSAFLGLQFARRPVRICMTGAFFPMNSGKYDGDDNLQFSLRAVTQKPIEYGVFACFPGSIGVAPGAGIMPPNYDDLQFHSLYSSLPDDCLPFGSVRQMLHALDWNCSLIATHAQLAAAKRRVALVRLYPGMDMRVFDRLATDSILVLEGYHSGTGTTNDGPEGIIALAKRRRDLRICLASIPSPIVVTPYEASLVLAKAGVLLFRDLPPHVLYVGALLGFAEGVSPEEIIQRFHAFKIQAP